MNVKRFFRVASLPSEHSFKMNISSDEDVIPISGVEYSFLNFLAQCMDFGYKIVIPADREFGRMTNDGKWTGIIGMTRKGEADFGLNMLAISFMRSEAVTFSYPYMVDGSTFVTEKPELLPKTLAFFYPFDRILWTCLIAVLITMPFVFKLTHRWKYSLGRLFLEIIGSFFQQPLNITMNKLHQTILCAAWFFYVRFTVLCYSVLLLSFLTIPLVSPGIHTVQQVAEVVEKGTYKCYVFEGTADQDLFYTATQGPLYIIGQTIKKHNRLVQHGRHIKLYIQDSKTILIGSNTLIPFNYMSGVYQNYYISKEMFYITLFGIPVKNNFCCLKQMNKCISKSFAAGLYQKYLADEVFILKSNSIKNEPPEEKTSVLGFYDLCSAFIILAGGYVVSILCLCFEMVYFKKKRGKQTEKRINEKKIIQKKKFG